ncbi:MAG: DUF302 domain-containing protein [Xanthomonadales bacterium]|nr:DUF302 domain-containing protein [Xanthomonadales bacterium]
MNQTMGFEVRLDAAPDEAIDQVTEALKAEGFGILTRIDVDQAFKEKIGEDFRPYTILGACNPSLAHAALSSEPELGLMLPCNVTVEAAGEGSLVRIVDPDVMMSVGNLGKDETVREVARDARKRLLRVADVLN